MQVREPLIVITAAFGFATSIHKDPSARNIEKHIMLVGTRPTAIN